MSVFAELADGRKLEFPDGTDPAVIQSTVKKLIAPQTEAAQKTAPSDTQKIQASLPGRMVQGVRDVLDAGAQAATHILPDSLVDGVNKATGWVNRQPVIGPLTTALGMTPASRQEIDSGIKSNEDAYQASRKAVGNEGIDFGRLAGNIAANAPFLPTGGGPTSGKLLAQSLKAMPAGAALGAASQPVIENQENFWKEKGMQAGVGAAAAGAAPAVMGGIARVVSPQTRESVKLLMKEGVTPTPGQIMGGTLQRLEDKATSIPIIGDAIASAQRGGIKDLNRAMYARALSPIGKDAPSAVGREGVAAVKETLGQAYDDLLPKMGFAADEQFTSQMGNLRSLVQNLPKREAREFDSIIAREISERITDSGRASGETLKQIESQLGKEAKRFSGSTDAYQQKLGDALKEAQNIFKKGVERSNPELSGELSNINRGYANYARIRDAASRQGSADGVVTPGQLAAAVRASDKSVGKGNYAQGSAYMQDLSDAAKDVLASKYPDSGSIGRLGIGAAAVGGGAMLHPGTILGAALGSLPYLPGGRQATAAVLAKRPESAKALAEALRKLPAPAAAPLVQSLLQANE